MALNREPDLLSPEPKSSPRFGQMPEPDFGITNHSRKMSHVSLFAYCIPSMECGKRSEDSYMPREAVAHNTKYPNANFLTRTRLSTMKSCHGVGKKKEKK